MARHPVIGPAKNPEVTITKLGHQKSWGQYWRKRIYLDPRLKGKQRLEVYVHELLHHRNPHWEEWHVTREAKLIAGFLWRHGYRKSN